MNRPIADETSGAPWWLAALLVSGLTILPLLAPLLAVAAPGDPPVSRNDHDGDGIVDAADVDDDNPDGPGRRAPRRRGAR